MGRQPPSCVFVVMTIIAAITAAIINIFSRVVATGCLSRARCVNLRSAVASITEVLGCCIHHCGPRLLHPSLRSSAVAAITGVCPPKACRDSWPVLGCPRLLQLIEVVCPTAALRDSWPLGSSGSRRPLSAPPRTHFWGVGECSSAPPTSPGLQRGCRRCAVPLRLPEDVQRGKMDAGNASAGKVRFSRCSCQSIGRAAKHGSSTDRPAASPCHHRQVARGAACDLPPPGVGTLDARRW